MMVLMIIRYEYDTNDKSTIPEVDFSGSEDVVEVAHGEEGVPESEQQQQQQLVLAVAAQLAQDAVQVELPFLIVF